MSDNFQLPKGALFKVATYQCATKIDSGSIESKIDEIDFDLQLVVSEMNKLANVDLYKILRTDEAANISLTCVLTQGTVFLLNASNAKAKNVMRQPLKIISERLVTLLDDDAITRLRVLE